MFAKFLQFIKSLLDLLTQRGTKEEKLLPPEHATIAPAQGKKPPLLEKVIVIDPGHGGEDPGTVYKQKGQSIVSEKYAALALSLTLKYLLTKKGWKVYLTRSKDLRPAYSYRTKLPSSVDADAFVSIHFNTPHSYGLVYYAGEKKRPISKRLARIIGKHLGFRRLWSSTESRFGRLYIDDVRYDIPSVLVEIDSIDKYEDTKAYRLRKAKAIVNALEEFFDKEEEWTIK